MTVRPRPRERSVSCRSIANAPATIARRSTASRSARTAPAACARSRSAPNPSCSAREASRTVSATSAASVTAAESAAFCRASSVTRRKKAKNAAPGPRRRRARRPRRRGPAAARRARRRAARLWWGGADEQSRRRRRPGGRCHRDWLRPRPRTALYERRVNRSHDRGSPHIVRCERLPGALGAGPWAGDRGWPAATGRRPAARRAAHGGVLGLDGLRALAALALLPAAHGWEASTAGTLVGAAVRAPGCRALRCSAPPESASDESRISAAPRRRSASQPANPVDA
jgi:hypothetical protein